MGEARSLRLFPNKSTMTPKYRKPTTSERIAMLENIVAKTTTTPTMRRFARLTLNRLKAKTTQGDLQSLTRGKQLARETYLSLWMRRSALVRKSYRNSSETKILDALLTHLPDREPLPSAHNSEWCDFVSGVTNALNALKGLR